MPTTVVYRYSALLILMVVTGCATQPVDNRAWPWPEDPWVGQQSGSSQGAQSPRTETTPGRSATSDQSPDMLVAASEVAQSLVLDARQRRQRGDYAAAVQRLERAISITPRDPVVWFELARVRLAEEQWAEAENLAQRALEYAYQGDAVIPWCWELVAHTRDARGDAAGADAARRQARVRS